MTTISNDEAKFIFTVNSNYQKPSSTKATNFTEISDVDSDSFDLDDDIADPDYQIQPT